jgi:hypothetical protein
MAPGESDVAKPLRRACQFGRKRKRFLIRILEMDGLIAQGLAAGAKLPPPANPAGRFTAR